MVDFTDTMFGTEAPPEVVESPVTESAPEAVTPEVEVNPAPEPAAVEPEYDPKRFVPLHEYLDKRDSEKELKRRVAEYERREQERERESQPAIDPYDNPEAYAAQQRSEFQAAIEKTKLDLSWAMATQATDEATVVAARDWAVDKARSDPAFNTILDRAIANEPHPFSWLLRQHRQSADLEDYSKDPVAFAQRILASHGTSAATVAAPVIPVALTQPAVKPAVPPRSIASDTTATGNVVDPSADFMAIFDKR